MDYVIFASVFTALHFHLNC